MPTLNSDALDEIIAKYIKSFRTHRPKEIYKWHAVKHFQDNWMLEAEEFARMFKEAFKKRSNLFAHRSVYAGIEVLVEKYPEDVRDMFYQLYNNDRMPIEKRIIHFISTADELSVRLGNPRKAHQQTERSVSLYLFLNNPEQYYIYNIAGKLSCFATKVGYTGVINSSNGIENYSSYNSLCKLINNSIIDTKYGHLRQMSKETLLPINKYYQDDYFHLLTDDIVYYVYAYFPQSLEMELTAEDIEAADINDAQDSSLKQPSITTASGSKQISKKPSVTKHALLQANYKCEHNPNHKTFMTKDNHEFMEGHHLIRCTVKNSQDFWNKYQKNIDTEANIVSLCPNCHRQIHLGNNDEKKVIIEHLYNLKVLGLSDVGIELSLKKLKSIYNI